MEIKDLIKNIQEDKYTEKQLINLYNNAIAKKGLDELEKELLIEAIEKNTRVRFPRAAKRIFGAKGSVASEKLAAFYNELAKEFDLVGNKLKNGVKAGGDMISGKKYIDFYISYKNSANQGIYMALLQNTVDDELETVVTHYQTHSVDAGNLNRHAGTMDSFDELADQFKAYLAEII